MIDQNWLHNRPPFVSLKWYFVFKKCFGMPPYYFLRENVCPNQNESCFFENFGFKFEQNFRSGMIDDILGYVLWSQNRILEASIFVWFEISSREKFWNQFLTKIFWSATVNKISFPRTKKGFCFDTIFQIRIFDISTSFLFWDIFEFSPDLRTNSKF